VTRTDWAGGQKRPGLVPWALATAFILILSSFLLAGWRDAPSEPPGPAEPQTKSPSQKASSGALQQKVSGLGSPITVLARNWEKRDNRIFADGNVEIIYKDIKILADQVEVNTDTKDILASGDITIQLPEEVVQATRIFYNMDTRQGRIERADGMLRPNIFYRADILERTGLETFSLTKASLTSCTQPTPRWGFSCSRAKLKKDDYVEMWNSVLKIKKIPVFYIPYFRYPLNRERATGFLMPEIGYSGVKGYVVGEAFYWAIRRNMDATFDVDYYSNKGLGAGLEYRYLFGGGTGGEARLYSFRFKPGQSGSDSLNAYILRLQHNQPLPYNFRLVANVDYQTSFNFLREFDNSFKRAMFSNFRSEAYISRSWSYYNFSVRASRYETLFQGIGDSIITYYLPQATLNSFKIKLFSPLYFSFNSTFTSWKYGWKSEYDNGREKYYRSVGFNPTLSLPFSRIPWLTLNSALSSNLVYYAQSFAPGTRRIVNEPLLQFNYTFDVEMTGPVFYRIFYDAQGAPKVKHLFEPFVSFRYDSPVNEPDRIVTAYGFFRYYQLSYGLTNRVLVKREMPREILTWGLSQTYYFSPEDSPLSIYSYKGQIPRYSDINSYLRFYPFGAYSLDVSVGYNTYNRMLSFVRLSGNLNSYNSPFFLSVSWFKSLNPWFKDTLWDRQQVGVTTRLAQPRFPVEFLGEVEFNILERKLLYSGVSLVYHYQCLDFKADVRIYRYREKPEVQYRISLGLGNIGKTTDFMGGAGF
jgi:lipopolysaccharide assembly outer membrane protein LptD (OstA)